jgi:hypothetical protein
MYSTLPSFILGFHGCDISVAEKIISGGDILLPSNNDYDWLGNGIYFWEDNPERALDYAKILRKHPERTKSKIKHPSVIGAIIDLGHCLNLLESKSLGIVRSGYELLKRSQESTGRPLPSNKPAGEENDVLLRKLDCAVIETIHSYNKTTNSRSYDSVRGVFWEGRDLYPDAGFKERNHIQVCVRNHNCIKGYFHPRDIDRNFPIP